MVTRRTVFELRKARDRAHLLEGLAVALANIDPIIALIKAAATPADAKQALLDQTWESGSVQQMLERADATMSRPAGLEDKYGLIGNKYQLSPAQAQAILELRLHRLTGLEQEKIHKEYAEILEEIIALLEILRNPDRLMEVITEELNDIKDRFGDERRTEIIEGEIDLSMEDLIPEEDLVVTLSHAGYAKSQPISDYVAQKRGGKGRIATRTREEDFVGRMFVANSHDTILCFSDKGKVYWLRVFQLPQAGRQARGKPLVNLLPLDGDEQVTAILPVKGYDEDQYIVMATAEGTVKKCKLTDFSRPRASGIIAVSLREDDHLIGVALTDGSQDILLVSSAGKATRFKETDVRTMGRTAGGVRGIRLGSGQKVISLIVLPDEEGSDESGLAVLTSTENGFGKRTLSNEFPRKNRGGMGVIAIKTSSRNGDVVSALSVEKSDEVMLITNGGILIRTKVDEISVQGRNTQGVRLISLKQGEALVSVGKVEENSQEESNGADNDSSAPASSEEANNSGESLADDPDVTVH